MKTGGCIGKIGEPELRVASDQAPVGMKHRKEEDFVAIEEQRVHFVGRQSEEQPRRLREMHMACECVGIVEQRAIEGLLGEVPRDRSHQERPEQPGEG